MTRGGIEILDDPNAPLLRASVRVARRVSPAIRLFSVWTRLHPPAVDESNVDRLFWRSYRVAGITTPRRMTRDIDFALSGQVAQLLDDRQTAMRYISK